MKDLLLPISQGGVQDKEETFDWWVLRTHDLRTGTISVRLVWEDTSAKVPVVPASLSGAGINHIIKVQKSVIQHRWIADNKNTMMINVNKKWYQNAFHECNEWG